MKKALLSTLFFVVASGTAFAENEPVKKFVAKCSMPVATVAIGYVDCKSQICKDPAKIKSVFGENASVESIERGIATMFAAGLKESGCFRVVDINQFWEAIRKTGKLELASSELGVDKVINLSINKVILSKSSGVPLLGGGKFQFAQLGIGFAIVNPYEFTAIRTLYDSNLINGFKSYSGYSSWEVFGAGGKVKFSNEWNWSKSSELDAIARRMVIESVNQIANLLAKNKIVENPVLPEEDNRVQ